MVLQLCMVTHIVQMHLSQKIHKITLIKPKAEMGGYRFFINNDATNTKSLRKGKYGPMFVDMVNTRVAKSFDKGMYDYYNGGKDCVFYKGGEYLSTKIITCDGIHMEVNSKIETKIINESAHKALVTKKVLKTG